VADDDRWQHLVRELDAWASVTAIAPDSIAVSLNRAGRVQEVVIVMTPDQWDDLAGIMWGNVDDAVQDVIRTLESLEADERFAVYADYRLQPSRTSRLPDSTGVIEPTTGGEWVAVDPDGRVTNRYADWIEPDEDT